MPSPFPKPYETVQAGRATIRFFHGDSLQVLAELPERSVDVVVTSPPYNLGIQYRTYDDGKPQSDYLDWTGQWVAATARVLAAQGSLFLNVGAKPTEPWTALDVAQAARPHLRLQNILHWIKSIAIEAEAAGGPRRADRGSGRRPLQADQLEPLPQRLPRVRLPLHARGGDPARPSGARA